MTAQNFIGKPHLVFKVVQQDVQPNNLATKTTFKLFLQDKRLILL
jgi:hypothetical protein